MIEFGTNPCRYEWCGPRSDGSSPGEVFVCPRCDKHWVWEESTEVIGPSAQWVRFDPALKRTPAPPATDRPERWVRMGSDWSEEERAQARVAAEQYHAEMNALGPIGRVRRYLDQDLAPGKEDVAALLGSFDASSRTLLAVATQCGELREALHRVDRVTAARLYTKHKAEVGKFPDSSAQRGAVVEAATALVEEFLGMNDYDMVALRNADGGRISDRIAALVAAVEGVGQSHENSL